MRVHVSHLMKEGHGLAVVEDDGLVGANAHELGPIPAVPDAEDRSAAVLVLGDGLVADDAGEGRALVEQDARVVRPAGGDAHGPVGLEGAGGGLGPSVLGQLAARDAGIPLNDFGAERRGVGLAALPYQAQPLTLEVPRDVSNGTGEGRGQIQSAQMLLVVVGPYPQASSHVGAGHVAARRAEASGRHLRRVAAVDEGADAGWPLNAALPLGDRLLRATGRRRHLPIQLSDDDEPPAGVQEDGPIAVDPPPVAVQNARLSAIRRRQRRAESREVAHRRDAGVGRVHFDWHYRCCIRIDLCRFLPFGRSACHLVIALFILPHVSFCLPLLFS